MPDPIGHISAHSCELNYDMAACPTLRKCILLTMQNVCIIGQVDESDRHGYKAWSPMPKRNKETEKGLGYLK